MLPTLKLVLHPRFQSCGRHQHSLSDLEPSTVQLSVHSILHWLYRSPSLIWRYLYVFKREFTCRGRYKCPSGHHWRLNLLVTYCNCLKTLDLLSKRNVCLWYNQVSFLVQGYSFVCKLVLTSLANSSGKSATFVASARIYIMYNALVSPGL